MAKKKTKSMIFESTAARYSLGRITKVQGRNYLKARSRLANHTTSELEQKGAVRRIASVSGAYIYRVDPVTRILYKKDAKLDQIHIVDITTKNSLSKNKAGAASKKKRKKVSK